MDKSNETNGEFYFAATSKNGGSITAVFRLSAADRGNAILKGETVDGGIAVFRTVDETRAEFKLRACKELNCPSDHGLWREAAKGE